MSLFALYKNNGTPSRREIDDALAGNLCRCTGYRPIIDAANRMFSDYSERQKAGDWLAQPHAANARLGGDEKSRVALLKSLQSGRSLGTRHAWPEILRAAKQR